MIFRYFIILFSIISFHTESKKFIRNYDNQGNLIAEGWIKNEQKTDFWTFYHRNGKISKKGHFSNGNKDGYWYFYDTTGRLIKEGTYIKGIANNWWIFYSKNKEIKVQLKDGIKHGYALIYHRNKLKKAERYKADMKIGEWTSYFKFKRDNPNLKF